MFKFYYGQCKKCLPNTTRVIVVKSQLCRQHNEAQKKIGKPVKPLKPRIIKPKKIRYGLCAECKNDKSQILPVKYLCQYHNEEKKKREKSNRTIKIINKSEKKKSLKALVKELDDIFSLFIRHRGSVDGMNRCFTCNTILPIKELQDGHYESRKFKALRWEKSNNHPQCFRCNITLKGNYPVYALKMIEKYGKEFVDSLAIRKHNTVKWTRFEYKLMIKEYTDKLNELKKTL